MENEIWKPVLGYEGVYEISSLGRLRTISRNGKAIEPAVRAMGFYASRYVQTILTKFGKTKTVNIHSMVCEAFHGPRPAGEWARHLDGDRRNNRANNLAWGTSKENMADQYAHGTRIMGERCPSSRLTSEGVRKIRKMLTTGMSQTDIASASGISQATVSAIKTGRLWGHVR